MRAYRRRHAAQEWQPAELGDPVTNVLLPTAPADEQIERALLEARNLGFTFLRLATLARPQLAWRCQHLGRAIIEATREAFGKAAQ